MRTRLKKAEKEIENMPEIVHGHEKKKVNRNWQTTCSRLKNLHARRTRHEQERRDFVMQGIAPEKRQYAF